MYHSGEGAKGICGWPVAESPLTTLLSALVKVPIQIPTTFVTPQALFIGESTIGASGTLRVGMEQRWKCNGMLVGRV